MSGANSFVVVANRLPVDRAESGEGWEASPGGLVAALAPVLRRHEGCWVGWPGEVDEELEPFEFDAPPAIAASPAADEDPFALDAFPATTPAAAPVEPSFDLADIDLDLPSFEQPASANADLPVPGEALEPAALSPEHMEMETKLDLAIAYQEIGDKEGARELLDEVIKGGSSEQVSKASAMRSLLA